MLGAASSVALERPAFGQAGTWIAHTSQRQIVDLSASNDAIWAATQGGVFRYAVETGEISAFTASSGLHSVQTQAIAYDPARNAVWIGYRDGVLDRLDPETGAIESYRDISRADRYTSREINRIFVRGDSVYVATSFGVVILDPVRQEVRDTYSQFGSIAPATPVHDFTFAPGPSGVEEIWVATNAGLAHAPLTAPNLQDPASWLVETALPVRELHSIAYFAGKIYVGSAADIFRRDDESTYTALGVTGRPVTDLITVDDRLIGIERFDLFVVAADGRRARVKNGYSDPTSLSLGPDGLLWMGDRLGGLLAAEPPGISETEIELLAENVYPAGPYDNLFTNLQVGPNGVLWASGQTEPGNGFYRFDPPDIWTNYVPRFIPELAGTGSFERIYVDPRGHGWAGSSGNALVEVTAEGEVRRWTAQNSSLQPAASTADYVIVGGIASDRDGRIWVTNTASSASLHIYDTDGTWTAIPRVDCSGFSTASLTLQEIFIDSFDQKWIIVLDRANLLRVVGLVVLDTGGTPANPENYTCNFFASEGAAGQGLPGTTVTSVVEDRDGIVWIGTDRGLAFMINNGIVARDRLATPIWPQFADRSQGTFVLNGVAINDLAVDPANRLWAATREGVFVVQEVEGGYEIAQQFTSRNSPLLADNVVAVAVDPGTGMVYLATSQGLVSYAGDAVAAAEQVGKLKVYPNPARITEDEASIYIEGLVDETELRVVTLAGEVVWSAQTRGGRARWNGRDLRNQPVPSGMYLVVAVGQDGEGAAYGKVAIIR